MGVRNAPILSPAPTASGPKRGPRPLRNHLPLLLALIATTGCDRTEPARDQRTRPDEAIHLDSYDGDNWSAYGNSYGEQHFSRLTDINDGTVSKLKLAWHHDLGPGNPMSIPVVVDGVMYMSTGLSLVSALDAATGKLLWQYDSKAGEVAGEKLRLNWGIRGIAYWDGKVYTGTADGRLIALDAATGTRIWSVQTTSPGDGRFITGAPRVFAGKIIIGNGGADNSNSRGYVTTYDAATGRQLWRFFIVPGDPAKGHENKAMEMAARTWTGEWWKYGGGGHAWNAFTYDPETGTIFVGTGNGSPWNHRIRSPKGGDNLFLCSIVALDADTGAYKWHYQVNPGETWDYNAVMDMPLATLTIDGKPRKVLMQAPKNGFYYVIDRVTGKLISAEKIARVTWATHIDKASGRPVENPAARFPAGSDFELWPSNAGAHSWTPMAYNPGTGLAYIPKMERGMKINDRGIDPKHWSRPPHAIPGIGYAIDYDVKAPLQMTSELLAWNPATQKKAWSVPTFGGIAGGVMTTAGNLVFQGQLTGRFSAYAADSGKELWHFDTQAPALAAPISFRANGRQYVTILVGISTTASMFPAALRGRSVDYRSQLKRVLTFSLDGQASLPPAPGPFKLVAPVDPSYRADPKLAQQGHVAYSMRCVACHGPNAWASGAAPDLRGSAIPQSGDSFAEVVRNGALKANGMPAYPELTDEDLDALRQYLRSRADDLRHGRQGSMW